MTRRRRHLVEDVADLVVRDTRRYVCCPYCMQRQDAYCSRACRKTQGFIPEPQTALGWVAYYDAYPASTCDGCGTQIKRTVDVPNPLIATTTVRDGTRFLCPSCIADRDRRRFPRVVPC